MTSPAQSEWADEVYTFWCHELESKDWFSKSDATDAEIRRRFTASLESLSRKPHTEFLASAKHAFSAIILFDQLSRNIFRGNAKSFATDPLALAIARTMVARGWDEEIDQAYRVFAYLPFEHSENLEDQDTAIGLIEALGDDGFTRYAHAHRDVILRFGRFPHRNALLGRESTAEEQAYLSEPGSGF